MALPLQDFQEALVVVCDADALADIDLPIFDRLLQTAVDQDHLTLVEGLVVCLLGDLLLGAH